MRSVDERRPMFGRMRAAMDELGLTEADLNKAMNRSPAYANSIFSKHPDIRVSALVEFCKATGKSPNHYLGFNSRDGGLGQSRKEAASIIAAQMMNLVDAEIKKAGVRASSDELLDFVESLGGSLDTSSELIEYMDVYRVPDGASDRPILVRRGAMSLASQHWHLTDDDQLRRHLDALPAEYALSLADDQREASERGYQWKILNIDQPCLETGVTVRGTYQRHLRRPAGGDLIFNVCTSPKVLPPSQ